RGHVALDVAVPTPEPTPRLLGPAVVVRPEHVLVGLGRDGASSAAVAVLNGPVPLEGGVPDPRRRGARGTLQEPDRAQSEQRAGQNLAEQTYLGHVEFLH